MSVGKSILLTGAVLAALGVTLGAFGAHALKARLAPDLLAVYHTANQYHVWHALGILLIGVIALQNPTSLLLKLAGWGMVLGVLVFSGSLYGMALTGERMLGAITPIGGATLILAWLALAAGVVRDV